MEERASAVKVLTVTERYKRKECKLDAVLTKCKLRSVGTGYFYLERSSSARFEINTPSDSMDLCAYSTV